MFSFAPAVPSLLRRPVSIAEWGKDVRPCGFAAGGGKAVAECRCQ
jgi:hypothetical protein